MKSIGLRIKEARLARNMKQEELAERIGAKSPSAVSTWESGRAKPDCVTLLKICNVLEVSADQLLGYRSAAEVPNLTEWEIIKKYRYIDEFGKKAVNSVLDAEYERVLVNQPRKPRLRKLGIDFYDFPASAGTGNFLESELPEKIWVNESSEAEQADFVIPISGDSMEPTFHSGDRVFVVKDDALEEGDIGIFIVNGDAYIKELGNKCLISHNEAYKPILLHSTDSVYCCGRVLGIVEE